jgi:hypothetical protein
MVLCCESGADLVLSIPEIENKENEIVLYPNPVNNGILNIKGDYKSLSILTISGMEVLNVTGKKQINISNLSSGVYLTVLDTENGRTVKRIFVNNN